MKIAAIGGGSTYTPELIEGFARRAGILPWDELVLHDVSAERLDVVGGLARRILARDGLADRLTTTESLGEAVDGAAGGARARRRGSCSSGGGGSRPGWSTRRCRTSSGCSVRRPPGRAGSPRPCAPCR